MRKLFLFSLCISAWHPVKHYSFSQGSWSDVAPSLLWYISDHHPLVSCNKPSFLLRPGCPNRPKLHRRHRSQSPVLNYGCIWYMLSDKLPFSEWIQGSWVIHSQLYKVNRTIVTILCQSSHKYTHDPISALEPQVALNHNSIIHHNFDTLSYCFGVKKGKGDKGFAQNAHCLSYR